ncbi:CLUMA_CG013705, isoform A [Clunio marinus]|uniref:CLUMA_CG013705, isoform A n=1 Tax=Clunio marinus TaxID=568069 RepID=A0A1J1IL02_9DIPT|nr:CLUMA_CG013705, isoform A [Clunio marinus]
MFGVESLCFDWENKILEEDLISQHGIDYEKKQSRKRECEVLQSAFTKFNSMRTSRAFMRFMRPLA